MKKLVQLKNKENENLDPINKSYEERIKKSANDISLLNGTILYNNSSGTNENFILNDDINNYQYYEIFFKNALGYGDSIKTNSLATSLIIHYSVDHNYACTGCRCIITGTQGKLDSFFVGVNGSITDEINKYVTVSKIIGYK